jgi:hypothetical protein
MEERFQQGQPLSHGTATSNVGHGSHKNDFIGKIKEQKLRLLEGRTLHKFQILLTPPKTVSKKGSFLTKG